jgi:hypothetical protein
VNAVNYDVILICDIMLLLRTLSVKCLIQYKYHSLFFAITSKPVRGFTQLPVQWEPGAVFLGVKRPEYEAGQDLLLNDEVTNTLSSTCVTHLSSWHDA